jgi:predicted dehydrogenase
MPEPVRVALLGYGYWGPNLARNLALGEGTELAAICDASPAARERAARLHRDVPLLDDVQAVLADERIEALAVAVPMGMHHRIATLALQHGKHVLVEKPLAMTVAECDAIAAIAAERGLTVMCGHTFLFSEPVRAVRRYLESGELGDPYYLSLRRTNLGIVRSDGNAMWSLAPHDLSILDYWLDRPVRSVRATGAAHLQEGIEDVVFLSIEYEGGVLGHVHCSWLEPNKVRDATIVGSRKMIVYDDTQPEAKIRLYDKGITREQVDRGDHDDGLGRYGDFSTFQMTIRAGDILLPKLDLSEPLAREVAHFAACVRGEEACMAGAAHGRRIVAVLEAAQRSLAAGGAAQAVAEPAEAVGA